MEPPGQRHCQTVELGTELYRALENDPCVWLIGAVPKFQEEFLPAEIMNIFCTSSTESPDLIRPGALRRPGIPGSVQLKKYDKYIPSIYQTYVTAQKNVLFMGSHDVPRLGTYHYMLVLSCGGSFVIYQV